MPLYFFDTYDQGRLSRDEQGIECNSKSQVQNNAPDVPDMAREVLPNGPNHRLRVDVRARPRDIPCASRTEFRMARR
jgi:hypothetical protein